MNIRYTPFSRLRVFELLECLDPVPEYDYCVVPQRYRELVLTPREYEGKTVLAAYDRDTDTLYVQSMNS